MEPVESTEPMKAVGYTYKVFWADTCIFEYWSYRRLPAGEIIERMLSFDEYTEEKALFLRDCASWLIAYTDISWQYGNGMFSCITSIED